MKNKFLFINTAGSIAKIALFENAALLIEQRWEPGRELSVTLCQKIEELLKGSSIKKEDLAGILIFPGPGSFTGLRIGIAFANALAFGLSIPVFSAEEDGKFNFKQPLEQLVPKYDKEPHITKPRERK